MLKSYFLVAIRSLRRQPGYAAINVGGLGLGLACCFLIVLFVQHERSFDTYHANGDRTYRVTAQLPSSDGIGWQTPAGLAPMVEANMSGVETMVRIATRQTTPIRLSSGEIHTVDPLALVDPGILDAFTFEVLQGDPRTALASPSAVVLTESLARAFFGDVDPMEQSLTLERDGITLAVGGVIGDLPNNTHLDFEMLGSIQLLEQISGPGALENMTNWNYATYAVLASGVAPERAALAAAAEVEAEFEYEPGEVTAQLRPLPTLHFDTENPPFPTRDPRALWAFAAIAALILLIACVNFTNLATARAAQRAREVGVRKSLGAGQGQLVGQFLGESVLLSLFALAVAFVGVVLALPVFNAALGGAASLDFGHPVTLLGLAGIGLAAGLLAGSYPALYLTRFHPARVLKGDLARNGGTPALRKGLVVFQFTVSAFLLVSTLTVANQLRFMQSQDLGFAQEQVVTFEATPEILGSVSSFKQALLNHPSVISVAMANGRPGQVNFGRNYLWPGGGTGEEEGQHAASVLADADYLATVGLNLVEGRWFREGEADVGTAYVINETAAREMGFETPVGQAFRSWDGDVSGSIIGVVEDFHFTTLQQPIEPLVFATQPDAMAEVAVRLAPSAVETGIEHLQTTFAQAAPGYTLDYHFLDEDFERLYQDEARLSTLLGFFASVAVFIACLGIFGLAALAAQYRRKEIGVRKVLGASVQNLTAMLAGDYLKLVAVAFVVASPLAYLAMSRWLEGFAYAVGLGPGVFVLAGSVVLVIALLTVSSQALRAATADPIRALRAE